MYRVENKYIISRNERLILNERLETLIKADDNELNGEGYKISSLYFDDINDRCLLETIDGNPEREKYRIRIYNDSFDKIKLEVKRKSYYHVKKESAYITYEQMQSLIHGEPVWGEDNLDDPKTLFSTAIMMNRLQPKVIVTYERKAFVCELGNVRITFDENIRGSNRIESFGSSQLSYDYLLENGDVVLEVKFDEFLPDYISQILEINNLWQASISKYRICREMYI